MIEQLPLCSLYSRRWTNRWADEGDTEERTPAICLHMVSMHNCTCAALLLFTCTHTHTHTHACTHTHTHTHTRMHAHTHVHTHTQVCSVTDNVLHVLAIDEEVEKVEMMAVNLETIEQILTC